MWSLVNRPGAGSVRRHGPHRTRYRLGDRAIKGRRIRKEIGVELSIEAAPNLLALEVSPPGAVQRLCHVERYCDGVRFAPGTGPVAEQCELNR